MRKREGSAAPALGGSSLLTIFAVLCMTVLALLSVSTVLAEKRLSDAAAQAVTEYYAADLEANRIFARLRAGETVPGVQERDSCVMYTCPVSQTQTLEVELERQGESWHVLRWQTVAHGPVPGENLGVWDGT